jgi:hypothetical protein
MYDIAREQAPDDALLGTLIERSRASGYNALGLYLEHRFCYPSQQWAAAPGCLNAERLQKLSTQARLAGVRLIPFLNTLGHLEGFIRAEGGTHLAESPSKTLSAQICPSRPECRDFAQALVNDAIAAFHDEWLHLGGDETQQLGECPLCAATTKAELYGEYYADLCRAVLERGKRPCLWGDMLLAHPEALNAIPKQTLIFDWQYFDSRAKSTAMFRQRGFDVVCCPSIQTYNSGWCFLRESQENIDQHAAAAKEQGALGVLVTTWEHSCFSQYDATFPLIFAAGRRLSARAEWGAALELEGGAGFARAAEILGNEIPMKSRQFPPSSAQARGGRCATDS